MSMSLTVLGASPATQNPGGACSSYLVRQDETAIVLDLGSGAFANQQRHVAPDAITAIVISHLHADHVLDLIPYRYFLAFSQGHRGTPRLLLPPGGHEALLRLSGLQDPSPSFFADVFAVDEYDPAQPLRLGGLEVTFHAVCHIPHTYGMRVRGAQGSGALGYSADSGPCPALTEVARDTDLFLCESANRAAGDVAVHLAPAESASYARDGGARRLVLTHRWHVHGLDRAAREAAEVFPGPISVAREGETYEISPRRHGDTEDARR